MAISSNLSAANSMQLRSGAHVITLFTTQVPLNASEGNDEAASIELEENKKNSSKRLADRAVLLVEDELLIAMELEMALEAVGSEIKGPYSEVSDVLKSLSGMELDAAILDVNINGVIVFPIADILEKRGIPFLFHTGNSDAQELRLRYPAAPVIKKPCNIEEILNSVCALV